MKKPTRVITLAQLAIMPLGTVVSHIKSDEHGQMEFDCQGVLQLNSKSMVAAVNGHHLDLLPIDPDVLIVGGRVQSWQPPTTFFLSGHHIHRFILWE